MQKKTHTRYDAIVIGGGPAGMMAAGTAAARGLRVLLLEKNPNLGKKLLITGGGRCNVTNAEPDTRTFLANYTESAKFLFSTFAQFDNTSTLDFFHSRGVPTKVEDRGRVFPVSDSATSIYEALRTYLEQGNVTIRTGATVRSLKHADGLIRGVTLDSSEYISADSFVIATGGVSRPDTGSTGDGFTWLKNLGHTLYAPNASLVPIALAESWVKEVAGVTLPEVKLSVWQYGERVLHKTGRVLFTHVGLSGPMVLNLSKTIGELLSYDTVRITLDLFPKIDAGALDQMLVEFLRTHQNKLLRNALPHFVPASLAPVILELVKANPDIACHSVTKEERKRLLTTLKGLPLTVTGLLGTDKAIVTSGGVSLTEVNFKTMQSRLFPNLYLVGDILNIDRPSGGYSLQLCWSTGFVAGKNITLPNQT